MKKVNNGTNLKQEIISSQKREIEELKDTIYSLTGKNSLLKSMNKELEIIIQSQKKIHTDELAKKSVEKLKVEQELEKVNQKIKKIKEHKLFSKLLKI